MCRGGPLLEFHTKGARGRLVVLMVTRNAYCMLVLNVLVINENSCTLTYMFHVLHVHYSLIILLTTFLGIIYHRCHDEYYYIRIHSYDPENGTYTYYCMGSCQITT
jgi:uncharacterized integral membrane protein